MPAYDETAGPDAALASPADERTAPDDVRARRRLDLKPRPLVRRLGHVTTWRRYGLVVVLGLIVLGFGILEADTFATTANFQNVLLVETVPACVALAVLVPVIAGEFDLSVGYTLGFAAVVAAAAGGNWHMNGAEAILLALGAGVGIGLVNGLLVAVYRFGSLIATLGIGLMVSGLSVGVSGGETLSFGIPPVIGNVTTSVGLGLADAVWITLGLAVALYLVTSHTPFGRRLFATGANEHVARLAGVRTARLKILAFCLAGLLAAIGGLFQVGLSGAANPSYGANLLLPAFAAVFLGSTSIRPGTFNVWGTVIAILILAAGFSGLSLAGVPFWVEPVFDGCILIIAVFFSIGRGRQSEGLSG